MNYDRSHVIYSPSGIELSALKLGEAYLEVWRGLPALPFESTRSQDGRPALRYEQGGDYIYVTPMALEALRRDVRTTLVPLLHKTLPNHVEAWWVDLPTPNLEAKTLLGIIEKVEEANREQFFHSVKLTK